MKRVLKGFNNTFLLLIKALVILLLFGVFYLGYRPYSEEFRRFLVEGFNRVITIVASTFLVGLYVTIRLYGGLNIGRRKVYELTISMAMAAAITDGFTYIQLCVMEKKIMSIWILLGIFLVQTALLVGIICLGDKIFRTYNPATRVVLVYGELPMEPEALVKRLSVYPGNLKITKEVTVNRAPGEPLEEDSEVYRAIEGAEGVVMVGLGAEHRNQLLTHCYQLGKPVYFTPQLADILVNASEHLILDDFSLFAQEKRGLSLEERAIKRGVDLGVSLLMTVIFSPIMLIEALAIYLEDRGPVFYKQLRVTKGGKLFNVLKFRTMVVDAEDGKTARLAEENDGRITKVGGVLRKTRLDELPQLLNIIKGDMSLVGPRPERPQLLLDYEEHLPEFHHRLNVKAGLTGLAQILGRYDTSPKDKLTLDLLYIQNYSLRMDIKILFQTVVVCIMPGKGR